MAGAGRGLRMTYSVAEDENALNTEADLYLHLKSQLGTTAPGAKQNTASPGFLLGSQ